MPESYSECVDGTVDGQSLGIDEAMLNIYGPSGYSLWTVNARCDTCEMRRVCEIIGGHMKLVMNATFKTVWETRFANNSVNCSRTTRKFGEHGEYNLYLSTCAITEKRAPIISDLRRFFLNPVLPESGSIAMMTAVLTSTLLLATYLALAILLAALLVYCMICLIFRRFRSNNTGTFSLDEKPKSKRVQAIDVFRGFSIAVMIFVNYGGGQYYYFSHAQWHGLTVADLVFPWFAFIMGSSMAQSLSRLSGRRSTAMFAATRRSVLLFLIGVFVIGRDDSWKHKRIMGVLQRLAVAYFFTFAIRIFVSHKPLTAIRDFQNKHPRLAQLADIVPFWKDYICHLLLLLAWILTIFLVKVDGCPRGYIGPGGLTNNGRDANCTGGAAALIDRKILGLKHMYGTPTCQDVYECTGPFDPEGLLGCLTTIFQCFLGLQAGQIFVVYTKKRSRIVRLLFWALIYVLIGGGLCQFQYAGGAIPINKNLWTPTFVFVTSGFAMASLAALFYVIDVGEWWDGEPFASAVDGWVPVQWRVKETHATQLAMNAWGSTFWLIVAYIMNRQKVYFSL